MGSFWAKITYLKSLNRYEIDLSNEVLNIDFGQESAKMSEVKTQSHITVYLKRGTVCPCGSIKSEDTHRNVFSVRSQFLHFYKILRGREFVALVT